MLSLGMGQMSVAVSRRAIGKRDRSVAHRAGRDRWRNKRQAQDEKREQHAHGLL